ncbi:hypothetical protein [Streptomyces sp. NPDC097981]|uniref:hypothetical protein n=1 Tax=Streptomyces sp. NPDC097981 TaxID=3155428 RepID=UPI00331B7BBF
MEDAERELQALAELLEELECRVHRPRAVPWSRLGGYSAAMPRDALLVMGDAIVEASRAWRSRRHEQLAYWPLVQQCRRDGARWLPSPVARQLRRRPGRRGAPSALDDWVIGDAAHPAWDNPDRIAPAALAGTPMADRELVPAPHPEPRITPPLYMTSAWVSMNLLVVDRHHVPLRHPGPASRPPCAAAVSVRSRGPSG